MRREAGFTFLELVAVIVILGIMAVVVLPRLNVGIYRAAQFHDQTVAALRFAQKSATSHRRLVCVSFTASSVSLTIDHDKSGACDGRVLNLPGGTTNAIVSPDVSSAVFSPVPAAFDFQPDGSGADRTLSIAGQPDIVVVGATGHVQ